MIRVVLDTNIVVSAALTDKGLPAAIVDLAMNKRIRMITSADTIAEYDRVLRYPRLKLDRSRINAFLADIRMAAMLVKPSRKLTISHDESDNRFYECAEAGKAHFLVTGNTQHFPENHKETKIVTPREFIERIGLAIARGHRKRPGHGGSI